MATQTLTHRRGQALALVREGRVTRGAPDGDVEPTFLLDGDPITDDRLALLVSLMLHGVIAPDGPPCTQQPYRVTDDRLDYRPEYRDPPLAPGSRVRNYGEQYPAARLRGTAVVEWVFVHNGHLEYAVQHDDGRLTAWSDERTYPVGTVEED
jgi:hypothetical protein